MPVSTALQPAQQKSGLAPTYPCDLLQSENTVYSALKSNARYAQNQPTPSSFQQAWFSANTH